MSEQEKLGVDDAHGNCRQCGHPFDPHIVVAYDTNDFSKGGGIRCPVPECRCLHSLDFNFKTVPSELAKSVIPADEQFLGIIRDWLADRREILVLIRFAYAAGSKSFEFFSSIEAISRRLAELPARTSLIAFKEPQLPLRGIVDSAFIDDCLRAIPDGAEFVLVETVQRKAGAHLWFHDFAGETHAELREALEDSRGTMVAVGLYPPWQHITNSVISALIPDQDGTIIKGAY